MRSREPLEGKGLRRGRALEMRLAGVGGVGRLAFWRQTVVVVGRGREGFPRCKRLLGGIGPMMHNLKGLSSDTLKPPLFKATCGPGLVCTAVQRGRTVH